MLENKINLNLDLNNDQKKSESSSWTKFSKNDKPTRKNSERKDEINLIEENKTQLVFAVAVFSHLVMNW